MKKNIFDSKYVTKKKSGVSSSFLMVFMAVLGVFIFYFDYLPQLVAAKST